MARITFIILALFGVLTGSVFAIAPSLDLQIAAFFRDVTSRPEMRELYSRVEFIRDLGPLVTCAAIAPAVIAVLMKMFWPRRPTLMSSRAALLLVLSLALGPGLLVNAVLKENWARPRPGMVAEFGGDYAFKPWWDPRGTCDSNCSFVSGETSSAIWLAAPALLAPVPWNYVAVGAAVVYGIGIAFLRMLVGGHFLTDVIFAGVFTGLVIWAVHGLLYRWPSTRRDDRAWDALLQRGGSAVARLFSAMFASRGISQDKPTPPA